MMLLPRLLLLKDVRVGEKTEYIISSFPVFDNMHSFDSSVLEAYFAQKDAPFYYIGEPFPPPDQAHYQKIFKTTLELDESLVVMDYLNYSGNSKFNRLIFPLLTDSEIINLIDEQKYYNEEFLTTGEKTMPDSTRIKEIHASLKASKFAIDDIDPTKDRVANLGYLLERLARVISVNSDGSIKSIRNSKAIFPKKDDSDFTVPAGYSIGQWGEHKITDTSGNVIQKGGTIGEYRDGMVYQVRSHRTSVTINETTGEETATREPGGYVLVENIPQLLHIMMNDFDKVIGMQEAGSFVVPNADGTGKFISYEGLNSLMIEIAYMTSRLSELCSHTQIVSLATQMVVFELLRGLGVPVTAKAMQVDVGLETAYIHYPGLTPDAPTVNQQFMWVLTNLLPIIKSVIKLDIEPD